MKIKKTLTRGKLEKLDPEHRNNYDRRKKESYAVFSYFDESGFEYRRAFTGPVGELDRYFWNIAPLTIEI